MGKAPALLLGLPSLMKVGPIIITRERAMTAWAEGEGIVADHTLTKSGHYVLPLNTFTDFRIRRLDDKATILEETKLRCPQGNQKKKMIIRMKPFGKKIRRCCRP